MYAQDSSLNSTYIDHNTIIVDLRSDTFTKPTKRMREAMCNAEVGDDVYKEDPTVKKLEKKGAEMVGMEAAIFVSSGTMGNLIAIMNHCCVRGCEAYCNESAHCLLNEQGGAAQLAGVSLRPLRDNSDGTFDLDELESKLREGKDHQAISKLVVVENTLNGLIIPQHWIKKLVEFCKKHDLKLHMDGARLWNASIGSDKSAKEIVSGFDSVTFCFSKALGAPVGSLLCGSREFIRNARRMRKVLGGGMRQIGILAAAGFVALENIPNLKEDHRRAYILASSINEIRSKVFSVDLNTVQTNMVFVNVDTNIVSAMIFAKCLHDIDADENDEKKIIVKCLAMSDSLVRFVFSFEITDDQLMLAIKKIKRVILKLDSSL